MLSIMEMNDLLIKLSKVKIWRRFSPHVDDTVSKILEEMQCRAFYTRPDTSQRRHFI